MAVSATSRNSFNVTGIPAVVTELDLNENGTAAKRPLGFKVEDAQGNVYRWCHFGATTTPGKVVSQDISESGVVDTDNAIIASASCVTTTDGTLGSRFVEMTLASVTANQYAGGQFITTDDTGEGYTYNIVGNTATDDPATGNIRIELERPLVVAVDNTTDCAILGSRYGNLEPATSTDFDVVGVSMASMAAGDYGWVMSKGQAAILTQGTTTIGTLADVTSTAGAIVDSVTTTALALPCKCIVAGDSTGYGGFRFNFE